MIVVGDKVGKYRSILVTDAKLVEPELAERLDGSKYETGRFLPDQVGLRCIYCGTEFSQIKATVRVREVQCPNPACEGVEKHRLIEQAESIEQAARMERRLARAKKTLGIDQPPASAPAPVIAPGPASESAASAASAALPKFRKSIPTRTRLLSCMVHLPIDMLQWLESKVPVTLSRSKLLRMILDGELKLEGEVPETGPKIMVHFSVTADQMQRLHDLTDQINRTRERDERGGVSRTVRDIIRGKAKIERPAQGTEG